MTSGRQPSALSDSWKLRNLKESDASLVIDTETKQTSFNCSGTVEVSSNVLKTSNHAGQAGHEATGGDVRKAETHAVKVSCGESLLEDQSNISENAVFFSDEILSQSTMKDESSPTSAEIGNESMWVRLKLCREGLSTSSASEAQPNSKRNIPASTNTVSAPKLFAWRDAHVVSRKTPLETKATAAAQGSRTLHATVVSEDSAEAARKTSDEAVFHFSKELTDSSTVTSLEEQRWKFTSGAPPGSSNSTPADSKEEPVDLMEATLTSMDSLETIKAASARADKDGSQEASISRKLAEAKEAPVAPPGDDDESMLKMAKHHQLYTTEKPENVKWTCLISKAAAPHSSKRLPCHVDLGDSDSKLATPHAKDELTKVGNQRSPPQTSPAQDYKVLSLSVKEQPKALCKRTAPRLSNREFPTLKAAAMSHWSREKQLFDALSLEECNTEKNFVIEIRQAPVGSQIPAQVPAKAEARRNNSRLSQRQPKGGLPHSTERGPDMPASKKTRRSSKSERPDSKSTALHAKEGGPNEVASTFNVNLDANPQTNKGPSCFKKVQLTSKNAAASLDPRIAPSAASEASKLSKRREPHSKKEDSNGEELDTTKARPSTVTDAPSRLRKHSQGSSIGLLNSKKAAPPRDFIAPSVPVKAAPRDPKELLSTIICNATLNATKASHATEMPDPTKASHVTERPDPTKASHATETTAPTKASHAIETPDSAKTPPAIDDLPRWSHKEADAALVMDDGISLSVALNSSTEADNAECRDLAATSTLLMQRDTESEISGLLELVTQHQKSQEAASPCSNVSVKSHRLLHALQQKSQQLCECMRQLSQPRPSDANSFYSHGHLMSTETLMIELTDVASDEPM